MPDVRLPARWLDRALGKPAAVLGKRYVRADGETTAPGLDCGPGRREPVGPPGGQDHVRARFGECDREGDAES